MLCIPADIFDAPTRGSSSADRIVTENSSVDCRWNASGNWFVLCNRRPGLTGISKCHAPDWLWRQMHKQISGVTRWRVEKVKCFSLRLKSIFLDRCHYSNNKIMLFLKYRTLLNFSIIALRRPLHCWKVGIQKVYTFPLQFDAVGSSWFHPLRYIPVPLRTSKNFTMAEAESWVTFNEDLVTKTRPASSPQTPPGR